MRAPAQNSNSLCSDWEVATSDSMETEPHPPNSKQWNPTRVSLTDPETQPASLILSHPHLFLERKMQAPPWRRAEVCEDKEEPKEI